MYYIGIDIGGMTIKGGLTDENGKFYAKKAIDTKPEREYPEIVKDIAELCKDLAASAGVDISEVAAVGMGIPGTIDSARGVITYSNNINFEKVPIVKEFRKYIDVPTRISNDANVAALGEARFGSGKGSKDVVFVTLGTGVGTGIIVNGVLLEGKGGAGAEGGHTCLKIGGEPCSCGKRGCWEAYASATALIRQTTRAMEKNPSSLMHKFAAEEGKVSGKTAFLAAKAGDKAGQAVVDAYVKYVAEGIISMVNLFRPDCVLIGGGVSNEGDYFMKRVQRRVNRFSYGGKRNPRVEVRKAELKNDAGILGAVALCL